MNHKSSPFKWRHYAPDVILLCVRWYCRYQLSYRDVEEMTKERGLDVDHSTVFRWVQRYAPEINKRIRVLCFLLALYSFAVFGYVTATLATFFVGRDAEDERAEVAGAAQVERLREEVAALREELRVFARRGES